MYSLANCAPDVLRIMYSSREIASVVSSASFGCLFAIFVWPLVAIRRVMTVDADCYARAILLFLFSFRLAFSFDCLLVIILSVDGYL